MTAILIAFSTGNTAMNFLRLRKEWKETCSSKNNSSCFRRKENGKFMLLRGNETNPNLADCFNIGFEYNFPFLWKPDKISHISVYL